MSNLTDIYLERLSEKVKIQIIKDFQKFKEEGSIQESCLRTHAVLLSKKLGMDSTRVTTCMQFLSEACYKYFTNKYFQIISITEDRILRGKNE